MVTVAPRRTLPSQMYPHSNIFGTLTATQQQLYEDKPDIPYQLMVNWFGKGKTPAFSNSVFSQWLKNQQNALYSNFLAKQAQYPTAGLTWAKYLEENASALPDQFKLLPAFMRGSQPDSLRVRRELW